MTIFNKTLRKTTYTIFFVGMFLMILSNLAFAGDYVVIGNKANTITGDENTIKQQVKRLYLKEKKDWSGGLSAKVIDRSPDSKEHASFIKNVLGMTESELAQHWLGVKQKTGETPPRNISSTRMTLKLISKYDGALSIIKKDEANSLPENIRVLFTYSAP